MTTNLIRVVIFILLFLSPTVLSAYQQAGEKLNISEVIEDSAWFTGDQINF